MTGEVTPGTRVCSRVMGRFYHIPGTVHGRAQWQVDPDNIRYVVDLDDGHTEVFEAWELEELTAEIQEWYEERTRREEEHDRMQREKNARRAEGLRKQAEARANRGAVLAAEKAERQAVEKQENNEKQRRAHAREYGLQSLKR